MARPQKPFYHALIGDIRKSRDLEDRAGHQATLLGLLQQANDEFKAHILTPFDFTGGDEFKGLFATGQQAFRCAVWLNRRSQVKLRFGLGRGPLEVGAPGDPPGRLDGPCFHHARKAVDLARREDHWMAINHYQDEVWPGFDILINATLALLGRVQQEWTLKQQDTIALIETGLSQKAAAQKTGVAPSTVNQALKAAKWHEVRELENEIAQALASREARP